MEPSWIITIITTCFAGFGGIFGAYQKYQAWKAERLAKDKAAEAAIKVQEKQDKKEETDATIARLYAYIDRIQQEHMDYVKRIETEHNQDRENLNKLHEDYVIVRVDLSQSRERCTYLEMQNKSLEQRLKAQGQKA